MLFAVTKRTEFLIISLALILGRIGDGISTYKGGADLQFETNPLTSVFGLGWGSLIASNAFFISIMIGMNYFQIFYSKPMNTNIQVSSWKEYISMVYFGNKTSFSWFSIFKAPKNWKAYVHDMGYVLPRTFIVLSSIAMTNNFLMAKGDNIYSKLMLTWEYNFVWIYLFIVLFTIHYWTKKIKREYKVLIEKKN